MISFYQNILRYLEMFYIVIASIFLYVEWYFDIQKDFCIVLRFSELILYHVVRFIESSFVL